MDIVVLQKAFVEISVVIPQTGACVLEIRALFVALNPKFVRKVSVVLPVKFA